jgi:hypothetical protein
MILDTFNLIPVSAQHTSAALRAEIEALLSDCVLVKLVKTDL